MAFGPSMLTTSYSGSLHSALCAADDYDRGDKQAVAVSSRTKH